MFRAANLVCNSPSMERAPAQWNICRAWPSNAGASRRLDPILCAPLYIANSSQTEIGG